ncbi:hypothetical protein BN1058_00689 [Paraliobacillus sp. PM-2]|uniref:hypothetical protein n=1 Tax=Paraliobacillus sp. PM-2 TaxID=1462524 RepID=UPI00061BA0AF|nr:hypothetical protein [Paraliobacillus sp. PM-2]CQR46429.1 hypothetical protein BN1058_00689 [Paraliobacillus sp. PM-2]
MRRIPVLLFTFILVLTACGTQETLDKSEVLNNASKAVETLDSYTLDMVLNIDVMGMETTMDQVKWMNIVNW